MNSLLINFTIKHQEKILKNKSLLNNYDLFGILTSQIEYYNIPNTNSFRDLMYDYIQKRKNHCERQILKGNIVGTESEIPASTNINWLNNQSINKNPYSFENPFDEPPLQYKRRSTIVSKLKSISKKEPPSISGVDELINFYKTTMVGMDNIKFGNGVYYGSVNSIGDSSGIISETKVEPIKQESNDLSF